MDSHGDGRRHSRRKFLTHSATLVAAGAALPTLPALARSLRGDGVSEYASAWTTQADLPERRNINGQYGSAIAGNLRAAVSAMMALPPEDPRNWYRQAIIHVMDCPHANAWFFPWHRGYLYWFECIARKLTQNPNFALPYWDVTAFPEMPASFFRQDWLDTTTPGYIHDLGTFEKRFRDPLSRYWQNLNTLQLQQLQRRGFNDFDQFWVAATNYIVANTSRTLTASGRKLPPHVQDAVSMPTLANGLAPQDFFEFGGALTQHHSAMSGEGGLIESQVHNTVHDAVGGYMNDMLSASDPVFWLHHGNIDRLWDIWLQRKGLAAQDGPPEWRNEPFLFFCDEDGRPVNGIAGDYVSSEELNYRFQPSIPIDNAPTRPADAPWPSRFPCRLDSSTLQVNGDPVLAQVSPGPAACDAFRENCQSALVVELDRPDKPSSLYFQIEVKVVGGSKPYAFKHCGYASFFGSMGHRSPGHPLHAGSLKIGIANGLRRCLEEAGSGALDFQIALRLKGNGPLPAPLKVKSMSLISL